MEIKGRVSVPSFEKALDISSGSRALEKESSEDLGQTFLEILKEVNTAHQESKKAQSEFMQGKPMDYHDVILKMEKASIATELLVQANSKILGGLEKILNTQI
jgi:flagellar hook-basal body complex protein FliE